MRRAVKTFVLLCSVAGVATAQDATLEAGGRARVQTLLRPKWSYGRVISVDTGGVLLAPCTACEGSEIPRTHILKLQASAGRTGRSYALEGAIAGVIIGAVWGHAVVQRTGGWQSHNEMGSCVRSCAATAAGLLGGLLGAVAGTTVGAFVRRERWEPVNPWSR